MNGQLTAINGHEQPNATARLIGAVESSLKAAYLAEISPDNGFYKIAGMSGKRYRFFLHTLIGQLAPTSYLEVGTWLGAGVCSAVNGNRVVATVIDNWDGQWWSQWKPFFYATLEHFRTPEAEVRVIENDFRKVDYADIGKHEVFMFDGPHEAQDQYDGVTMALPALADQFVLLVDDWNWPSARDGTLRAIAKNGLTPLYSHEVRTTKDDTHAVQCGPRSDWHNGVSCWVLSK